jgi:hypothetical protein
LGCKCYIFTILAGDHPSRQSAAFEINPLCVRRTKEIVTEHGLERSYFM